MSANHTPGPWHFMEKLQPSYSDHGYRLVAVVRGAHVYAEASNMRTTDEKGTYFKWGDIDADARLIAAAPDLLAALEKAQEWMTENNSNEPPSTDCEPLLVEIRAAISKARL